MRKPTTHDGAMRWWRSALEAVAAGKRVPAITANDPQCGFYMIRSRKDGPWLPASITLEADVDEETGELLGPERHVCEVAGVPRNAMDVWTWLAKNPISQERYMQMLGDLLPEATPGPAPAPEEAPASPLDLAVKAYPEAFNERPPPPEKPDDVPY